METIKVKWSKMWFECNADLSCDLMLYSIGAEVLLASKQITSGANYLLKVLSTSWHLNNLQFSAISWSVISLCYLIFYFVSSLPQRQKGFSFRLNPTVNIREEKSINNKNNKFNSTSLVQAFPCGRSVLAYSAFSWTLLRISVKRCYKWLEIAT